MKLLKSKALRLKVILSITISFIIIQLFAQSDQVQNLPQFLFPDFSKSLVKIKAGKDFYLMLNYNIVTEKMVFLQKDQVYDMLNQENVDTIIMNSRKFVPVEKAFFEVLMEGSAKLYIQHRGNVQSPGTPAGYGGTSQLSSTSYFTSVELAGQRYNMRLPAEIVVKPETVFWININNNKYKFVNQRQFLKIFPGKEDEIKKYIKLNHLKFENQENLIKLVQHCTELMK
jgi:hypothetical protein